MPVHQISTGFAALNGSLRRALRNVGFAVSVAAVVVTGPAALARTPKVDEPSSTIAISALPAEAQETERLIRSGGPFPYNKDGSVFGNRERRLPAQARGYYREYTVKTRGSRDRGARRIVCGGEKTVPQACYYSSDHYTSFKRIVQ